jgi:putative DNA methylase
MADMQPNQIRLKGAKEFKPRELASGDLVSTLLSELLIAIQELLNDQAPKVVIG